MLQGKVCIVTGGSRGIGRAAARAIAAAGAAVVISSRDEAACMAAAAELRSEGAQAAGFAADVTSSDAMEALAAFALDRFGGLHLSFLNAGTIQPPMPVAGITPQRFDEILSVNLRGTFLALRAQMPLLSRQGGAVVITSAGSGLRGRAGLADYCASKWGVIGLALAAAQEAGPNGVRVNVVAPGYIASDAWLDMLGGHAAALQARVPLGAIGQPSDVADVVCWLLSDAARYVTGAVIPVDGGLLIG